MVLVSFERANLLSENDTFFMGDILNIALHHTRAVGAKGKKFPFTVLDIYISLGNSGSFLTKYE